MFSKVIELTKKKIYSFYNRLIILINVVKNKKNFPICYNKETKKLIEFSGGPNAISDHLFRLYLETILCKPNLTVELGVRGGDSTRVFLKALTKLNSVLISVDIEKIEFHSNYQKWHKVEKDDIQFAKNFKIWCSQRGITQKIDLLFIDSSHRYEHTKKEIKLWFPLLSKKTKVIFHDTNLKKRYKKKNGTIGFGWNNKRGVIRALEEYFETSWDETEEFIDLRKGWLIRHFPYGAGLTILDRINQSK